MSNMSMQKANFNEGYETVELGRIVKRVVNFDGLTSRLVRFGVGANVQDDAVKPGLLGEDIDCPLAHVAYILEGAIKIRQADGSEEIFRKGDIMLLPPHHDAWTVGDEDCLFVEFTRGSDDYYASAETAHAAAGH